jgi:hypothetical protein
MEQQPLAQPSGGRMARGWRLVKVSWAVVRSEKSLMILPLISLFCTILVWGGLIGAAIGIGGLPSEGALETTANGSASVNLPPVYYVFIALGYFLATFVAVYFNAVVIGVATIRLRGGDPKLSDGFRLANSKLPKIIGWALLTASVGMVLRALEERAGFLGRIVIAIIGVAWAIVTFFVVPVLLYEEVSVFSSVKRSGSIFKERWGEQFTGNFSIGIILFLVSLPVLIVCGALIAVAAPVGIVLMILAVGAMIGIGGALSGVFNAALYQYATAGQIVGGFSEADMAATFRPKKRRNR